MAHARTDGPYFSEVAARAFSTADSKKIFVRFLGVILLNLFEPKHPMQNRNQAPLSTGP
jgi:hypothetical protein